LRERANEDGLPQTGHPFKERIPSGEKANEHLMNQIALAHNNFADLLLDLERLFPELFDCHLWASWLSAACRLRAILLRYCHVSVSCIAS
jgi:hypothetical protein